MDLKLGKDNDILFVNGQCPVTTDRAEVVAQRLQIRFRTFYSEWFLNEEYGVPYLEKILGHKKVTKNAVDIIIHDQIRAERGVASISFFKSAYDSARRTYQCEFRVKTGSGEETEPIRFSL